MAMAEDVLAKRETASATLSAHIELLLNNCSSVEEAKQLYDICPSELFSARSAIHYAIGMRDWSRPLNRVETTDDLNDLVQAYREAIDAPMTTVVETVPVEERNFIVSNVMQPHINLGMFSTLENARAAQACGNAGEWEIFERMGGGRSRFALVCTAQPCLVMTGDTIEDIIPSENQPLSIFQRIE